MAVISRCCCWKNVRTGSFAAGFYTLVLYVVVVTGTAFNLQTVMDSQSSLALSLTMIACSICCVITSILLLIGLSVDSQTLLIPWLVSIFVTTSADFICSLYLLFLEFNNFLISLFFVDVLICAFNVYSFVCVFSQYQKYTAEEANPTCRSGQEIFQIEYQEGCHPLTSIIKDLNETQPCSNGTSILSTAANINGIRNIPKIVSPERKSYQSSNEAVCYEDNQNTFQLLVHHVPENAHEFESKLSVSINGENKSLLW